MFFRIIFYDFLGIILNISYDKLWIYFQGDLIMLWFIGYFFGLYLYVVMDILLSLIVGKSMGMSLLVINIFGNEGRRIYSKEKLKWTKGRFYLFPSAFYGKKFISKSEDFYFTVIKLVVSTAIFLGLAIYLNLKYKAGIWGRGFTLGISDGTVLFSLVVCFLTIKRYISSTNKELCDRIYEQKDILWGGSEFGKIKVYPELAADNRNNRAFRLMEYTFCCLNALDRGDYNTLGGYLRQVDEMLVNKSTSGKYDVSFPYTSLYYMIIYYSACINPNRANAIKFYEMIKFRLEADMEPAGRRVLAAFQLYIMNRPDLAAASITQAEQFLDNHEDSFLEDAELKLERKLIDELKSKIFYGN